MRVTGNRTVTSVAIILILLGFLSEKLDKSKRKCKGESVGGVGRYEVVSGVRSALSNNEDWRSFIDNRSLLIHDHSSSVQR